MKLWLVYFLLAMGLYLPSLTGPYILDDSHTIQTNDAIQNPANLLKLWTSAKYYSSSPDNWGYRPVQTFVNAVCWQLAEGATWPFHLLKVLSFSFVALFFTLSWRRLLPKASFAAVLFAGLFFLLNPVQTQVVSYISATSTLLAGLFVSWCIYQYLLFREDQKIWRIFFCAALVFLAMLSKEEGVVVVGILPLVEIFKRLQEGKLRFSPRDFLPFLPIVVSAAAALALIFSMFEPTSDLARGDMNRWIYFATQWRAWLRYMAMYFVPYDLNADNINFGFSPKMTEPLALLALAANFMLLIAAVVSAWKKKYLPLFCLIWFYGTIAPASSVIVLAEPVNDHRAFIAYLGWGGLLIPLFDWGLKNAAFFTKLLVALWFVSYAGVSMARNHVWSSNLLLWEDTLAKNPTSVRAHNNATLNYMHNKEWDKAAKVLDSCLQMEPKYAYCLINRALVAVSQGQEEAAEGFYKRAVEGDFAGVHGRRYYADFLLGRGRLTEALALAEKADEAAQGQNLFVRVLLIRLHLSLGDKTKAQEIWKQSYESFGADPNLLNLRASLGI